MSELTQPPVLKAESSDVGVAPAESLAAAQEAVAEAVNGTGATEPAATPVPPTDTPQNGIDIQMTDAPTEQPGVRCQRPHSIPPLFPTA